MFEVSRLVDSVRLVSFVAWPFQGRAKKLYDVIGDQNSLCEDARYLNLGYWGSGAQNLDAAGDAMARLMSETAQLDSTHEVLDVGFGFADQDFYWDREYRPRRLVGLNLNERQVEAAREKAKVLKRDSVLSFVAGDAVAMPFADSSFDIVFALESAFHFRTRDAFFREAFRVLRPGGRLVMVDLAGLDKKNSFKEKIVTEMGRAFWQIPKENLYPAKTFQERLYESGFKTARVESIWNEVYPPFIEFAKKRLKNHELKKRLNPAFRMMLSTSVGARRKIDPEIMDYVLAYAEKAK